MLLKKNWCGSILVNFCTQIGLLLFLHLVTLGRCQPQLVFYLTKAVFTFFFPFSSSTLSSLTFSSFENCFFRFLIQSSEVVSSTYLPIYRTNERTNETVPRLFAESHQPNASWSCAKRVSDLLFRFHINWHLLSPIILNIILTLFQILLHSQYDYFTLPCQWRFSNVYQHIHCCKIFKFMGL